MWLVAWKFVSNDAKRTVAPPKAKHSTLPQGCFLCFCFWFHSRFRQQCRIYPQECSTEPAQLGDSSKIWCRASERVGYDDEEEDIHITTDPLRGSYCVTLCYHQAACPCMQRHLHGISHHLASPMPTPTVISVSHRLFTEPLNRCHLTTPQKIQFVKICANSWLRNRPHTNSWQRTPINPRCHFTTFFDWEVPSVNWVTSMLKPLNGSALSCPCKS